MAKPKLQTLTRGDGAHLQLRVEAWQHDPYRVYLPLSGAQYAKALAFQNASEPVIREDGRPYPTTMEPLRWGTYSAKAVLYIAQPGACPHC